MNKKGFTLVEIIVTLGLMLLITGVAIGSFIGISKQKKKEEWSLIKDQIETSAGQYFTSYKYLFEEISSGNAYISVGKLVNDNYLNTVTDPRTGKKISKCTKINVTYSNNKFNVNLDETTINSTEASCNYINGSVIIKDAKAPNGSMKHYKKPSSGSIDFDSEVSPNTDGWYNIKSLDSEGELVSCLDLGTSSKQIKQVKLKNSSSEFELTNYGGKYCYVSYKSGIHNNQIFEATDYNDRKLIIVENYKVDTIKPTATLSVVSQNTWNSRNVKLTATGTDEHSKINSYIVKVNNSNSETFNYYADFSGQSSKTIVKNQTLNTSHIYNGSVVKFKAHISDNAGNISESVDADYTLYKECESQNLVLGDYKNCGTCSKPCDGGTQSCKRAYTDINTNAICNTINAYRTCNTQTCPTTTTTKTTTKSTTTTKAYASSCSASKVYSSNTACKSGAGNTISARLKVKCNGKIDYVQIKYYYPGAEYSTCHGNSDSRAVCKHYPGGSDDCSNTQKASNNINGAVFNLRGCGVSTVKYKYKVVANGKIIKNYADSWTEYNFTNANNASLLCSPDAGSTWFD